MKSLYRNIAILSFMVAVIFFNNQIAKAQIKDELGVSLSARFYWPHVYAIEIGYQPSETLQLRINGSYMKGKPLNYFAKKELSKISLVSDSRLNIDRSVINVGLYFDYFIIKQFLPKSTLRDIAGGFKLSFGMVGDYDITNVSFKLNDELIKLKIEPKWVVTPYFGIGYEYFHANSGVVVGLDIGIIYNHGFNLTLDSKSDDEELNAKITNSFQKQMKKVVVSSPAKFLASISIGYKF